MVNGMRSSGRWLVPVLASVLLVAACGGAATTDHSSKPASAAPASATAAGGTITVEGGSGSWAQCLRDSWFDPFEKETGIKVISAPEATDFSGIRTAVETGTYDMDVWYVTSAILQQEKGNLFEPIDYTQINRDEIVPGLDNDYGVGFDPFSIVVGFNNTATAGKSPTKLEDYFDLKNFPGKRGYNSTPNGVPYMLAWALLADGVAPDQVFPLDVERALKYLDSTGIKKELVGWATGSNSLDLINSGETPILSTFANRVKEAKDGGTDAGLIWDGQLIQSDFWAIPKGDPNKENAMKFIAWVMSKEHAGAETACIALAAGNKLAAVDTTNIEYLGTSHLDARHIALDTPAIVDWLGKNQDAVVQRFNDWLNQ